MLHERRIIHRDIKPDNVLFTEDGNVVLADFGICRSFGRDAEQHPWTVLDEENTRPGLRHFLGDKCDNKDGPDVTRRCRLRASRFRDPLRHIQLPPSVCGLVTPGMRALHPRA